jgi:nicotinate-nucleotide pyrophosphorylase
MGLVSRRLVHPPRAGRAAVEASGGVSLANVNEIASTGVDLISVGWITHSAPILDLGMDVVPRYTRAFI